MERQTRRQFLLSGLAVVGGAALGSVGLSAPDVTYFPRFSPTGPVADAGAAVAAIDTRWPIKRVVYLMLENRSFDHVFGSFPGVDGATVGNLHGKEVPLGHGDMDWEHYLSVLEEIEYRGWVDVRCEGGTTADVAAGVHDVVAVMRPNVVVATPAVDQVGSGSTVQVVGAVRSAYDIERGRRYRRCENERRGCRQEDQLRIHFEPPSRR